MDIWIFSQDKEDLVKTNSIWVMDNQIWMEVPFYENHKKLGLCITGHNHKLATYKSKERALEVIKEINDIKFYKYIASLNFKHFINIIQKYSDEEQQELLLKMNTYEMPKE